MRKIKVLHLIKTLDLGGAETNLFNLVNAMDVDRVESHVGYSHGGQIESRFSGIAHLYKYARSSHRIKSPVSAWIVARLSAYVMRHQIDVIHTHNFNAHVWGCLAAKITKRKIVEHVHDFRYLDPAEYRRRHGHARQFKYAKYLKNVSDRVVVLTEQNRRYLLDHGLYPESKIRLIPNGLPPCQARGERAEIRRRLGLGEATAVILTASRLSDEKNISLVLRVAPRVLAKNPGTVFVVAGSGPLLDALRREAADKGLERGVRFIGFHPDVGELLTASDIFFLPSFLELHSIAILEALDAALPVVVSGDAGCNAEFLRDGENGFLCDPFGDAGWSEALNRLLADADLRRRVGESGRRTCRELFDIRKTASRFEELYAELVL